MTAISHATNLTWADNGGVERPVITRTEGSPVIRVDFVEDESNHPLPAGAVRVLDFLDEIDATPEVAAHLPAVRQELAASFEARAGGVTLKSLRLARGLSQEALAEMLGTSQSRLSRLESRRDRPGEEMIRRLAATLHVDFNTLMDALSRAGL